MQRYTRVLGFHLLLMAACLGARADETLPALKAGGQVFSNVIILNVTASDVYFTSASGMGNVKITNLDLALQRHLLHGAKLTAPKETAGDASEPAPSDKSDKPDKGEIADPQSAMDDAIAKVKRIVNQPVTQLKCTPDMEVSIYKPGWFHPGAKKPDFDTVDIRTTQDCHYGKDEFVSSDINPGIAFRGADLEFNSMTKYFYTDRGLPKKKLTESEMLEINRLYRIIGKCEKQIETAKNAHNPVSADEATTAMLGIISRHRNEVLMAVFGLILVFLVVRTSSRQSAS